MRKKAKKRQGFTIVELMLSFTLSVIIIIYLFNVILTLRNLYTEDGIKTQMLIKQAGISEEIGNDLDAKLVTRVNTCGGSCLRFTFEDTSSADLIWDSDARAITYDKHRIEYIKGSEIGAPSVKIEKVEGAKEGTHNSVVTIHIPVTHKLIDEDFGVTIVYPYDDRVTDIPTIRPEDFVSVKLKGSKVSGTPTRDNVTLTAEPRPKEKDILGGYTYIWQRKEGSTWVTVAQNTEDTLLISSEVNHDYRVIIRTVGGNEATSNTYKVIIDRTPPTCSITKDGTLGKNDWYVSRDVTLTLNKTDPGIGSGIAGYDITKSSTPTYAGKSSLVQGDTNQITIYGYVKDKAGNVGACTTTVKVDKTAPGCTSTGGSDTWTNGSRTLIGTCTDATSGCTGNVSKPFTTQGSWTNQSPGTVYDAAGNSTVCPANQTVKIDKTKPTCSISLSGTVGENGWYRSAVTLTLNRSDTGGSGISAYGLTTSTTATYNNAATSTQNDTNGVTWKGYVKDGAGNTIDCTSASFKVDKTPPTISTFKATSTNSGYNVVKVNLGISASDAHSMKMYISNSGYGTGGSWENYGASKAWTVTGGLDGKARTIYLRIKDEAGNVADKAVSYTPYKECSSTKSTTTYGNCSASCGGGTRSKTVKTTDTKTGKVCSNSTTNESCNTQSCNKNGWVQETCWKYYNNSTTPVKGWQQLVWNGVTNWYYMKSDGCMTTGWLENYDYPSCASHYYYFNSSGAMLSNTTTPDGYYVDSSGCWIKDHAHVWTTRGDTIHNVGFSWTCTQGHTHTSGYYVFCSICHVKSNTTPTLVCPSNPYGPADGWGIISG